MTDLEKVILDLKNTRKGRLKYYDAESDILPPKIPVEESLSPVLKTLLLVTNHKQQCENWTNSQKEKDEIGPVFASPASSEQQQQLQPADLSNTHQTCNEQHVKTSTKKSSHEKVTQSKSYVKKSNETALLSLELEYDENAILTTKSLLHLGEMQERILELDIERYDALNEINLSIEHKLNKEERALFCQQEKVDTQYKDELQTYKKKNDARALVTSKNIEKLKSERAELIKKQQEVTELRERYVSELETQSQVLKKIFSKTQKNLILCRQKNCKMEIVVKLVKDFQCVYLACAKTLSDGLQNQIELKAKVEYVSNGILQLEGMYALSQSIVEEERQKDIKEQKHLEEQMRIEAEKKISEDRAAAEEKKTSEDKNVTSEAIKLEVSSKEESSTSGTESSVPTLSTHEQLPSTQLEYERLMKVLNDTEKSYEKIEKSQDKQIKMYKFDLYKAMNTAVNTISSQSTKHLLENIKKVSNIFAGKEVVVGKKKLSTHGQLTAVALCKALFCKKLVMQGVQQVSSSLKASFPFACVGITIAAFFPDCLDLLLACFYKKCPLLVPHHFERRQGQSDLDYFQELGYDVVDGKVDDTEQYLTKLSGIVRLYAALIQTNLPPALGTTPHPFGLENGWIWLSRTLNSEPQPLVTATALYEFLQVAGYALMAQYDRQFRKLLQVLCVEYLPKIEKITPADGQASIMRLKIFLEDCIKCSSVPKPEGVLDTRWWNRL